MIIATGIFTISLLATMVIVISVVRGEDVSKTIPLLWFLSLLVSAQYIWG